MTVTWRLVLLFVATVFAGMAATMLAPALSGSLLVAHAQPPVRVAAASQASTPTPPALPEGYPRARSAAPIRWTRAIATRALVRGDTLRAGDFAMADSLLNGRLPYGMDTTTPQAGWLVQRAVAAGEWLRAPAVIPRPVVTAGQSVFVLYRHGAVQLSLQAVALNTAAVGESVSIRVGRTRRLRGIAVAPDSVRLK